MAEQSFQFDVNVEKFKSHIWRCFTARQIEDIQSTLKMYIEIVAAEEMNRRVYSPLRDDYTETKLQWVAAFSEILSGFLKISWQAK